MRKVDVINKIASDTGIPKVDVLVALETFFDTVRETLSRGESIHIRGVGSFLVKKKAKKFGRDIRRNITIEIPERNVPAFKPSNAFVEKVMENHKA